MKGIILTLLALIPVCIFGELTFSMVKPDAVAKGFTVDILDEFLLNNFKIVRLKQVHLTKEQAEAFYAVHKDKPFYPELVDYLSSGPVVAIILEGDNAVTRARALMGATNPEKAVKGTLRARFGTSLTYNAIHGSDAPDTAKQEIEFFFP